MSSPHRGAGDGRSPGDPGGAPLAPPDAGAAPAAGPTCNRCGFEVPTRPWGCKNPCPNCGTVYPLGDCSD